MADYPIIDKVEGFLEVGYNGNNEVIIHHHDLKTNKNGVGYIAFSPNQARYLANLLIQHANSIDGKE